MASSSRAAGTANGLNSTWMYPKPELHGDYFWNKRVCRAYSGEFLGFEQIKEFPTFQLGTRLSLNMCCLDDSDKQVTLAAMHQSIVKINRETFNGSLNARRRHIVAIYQTSGQCSYAGFHLNALVDNLIREKAISKENIRFELVVSHPNLRSSSARLPVEHQSFQLIFEDQISVEVQVRIHSMRSFVPESKPPFLSNAILTRMGPTNFRFRTINQSRTLMLAPLEAPPLEASGAVACAAAAQRAVTGTLPPSYNTQPSKNREPEAKRRRLESFTESHSGTSTFYSKKPEQQECLTRDKTDLLLHLLPDDQTDPLLPEDLDDLLPRLSPGSLLQIDFFDDSTKTE